MRGVDDEKPEPILGRQSEILPCGLLTHTRDTTYSEIGR